MGLGYWVVYFIVTVIAALTVAWLLSARFKKFVKKIWNRIETWLKIGPKKMKQLRKLESISTELLGVYFLVTSVGWDEKDAKTLLMEINESANEIKSKAFTEIKAELKAYADKANKFIPNMSRGEMEKLLDVDAMFKLADKIRATVDVWMKRLRR